MKTQAVFLFLFLELNAVLAQRTRTEQFGLGGDLQLNPVDPPKSIFSITWKHQGNIVAEWINVSVPLEFLGILKDRGAKLDLTTGQLTITGMKKTDEGLYTVEINNKVQSVDFTVSEVKPVPEPEVIVRPLTCSEQAEECTMSCEAKFGLEDQIKPAEPVEYFWKLGNGEWELSKKDKNITKSEHTRIKTFSCKLKNKISQKESPPLENPFNKRPESGLSGGMVAVIIIVVFLLVCVVLGAVGYKYQEKVKPYFTGLCKNGNKEGRTSDENELSESDKLAGPGSSDKNES